MVRISGSVRRSKRWILIDADDGPAHRVRSWRGLSLLLPTYTVNKPARLHFIDQGLTAAEQDPLKTTFNLSALQSSKSSYILCTDRSFAGIRLGK